jgi:energy-coupling factor transporter ATP-binding protein EcfA2
VQNFQSIRDQTVTIAGFTVITGPNNCGKTALLRAIQGVFTNAPAGPLVRHGASHLTVDIDFGDGDGNRVRWEKGEKINRYTVNGKVLDNVGRGVPPEVAELGLSEIKAGSDRLWPNFAQQFGGVLFLVDRPGSVVAEALSDVDKVGRLTDALRSAESDKRAATADLKIRRKDVEDAKSSLAFYEGIDAVEAFVDKSEIALSAIHSLGDNLAKAKDLSSRLGSARSTVIRFEPVGSVYVPDSRKAEDARVPLAAFIDLNARLKVARKGVSLLTPISKIEVPANPVSVAALRDGLREAAGLRDRLAASRGVVGSLAPIAGVTLPTGAKAVAQQGIELREVRSLRDRLAQARGGLDRLAEEIGTKQSEAEAAEQEVHALLGEQGECPVCNTTFAHGASA